MKDSVIERHVNYCNHKYVIIKGGIISTPSFPTMSEFFPDNITEFMSSLTKQLQIFQNSPYSKANKLA